MLSSGRPNYLARFIDQKRSASAGSDINSQCLHPSPLARSSWPNRNCFSRVLHFTIRIGGLPNSGSVPITHHNQPEFPVRQHARELALALSDRQGVCRIIPTQWDFSACTLFVVIVVVLIFIENEIPVCSGINSQLDRICRLLS